MTLRFRPPPQDVPRFVSDMIVALLQVRGYCCGGGDGDSGGGDGDDCGGGGVRVHSTARACPAQPPAAVKF